MTDIEMQQRIDALSMDEWQKLFALLPAMKSPEGGSYGSVEVKEYSDGSRSFPYTNHAKIVNQFIDRVYEMDIVMPFDWGHWEEGRRILKTENFDFSSLDMLTLCKLITAIVRADRFNDGFLLGCFKDGTFISIVEAMQVQKTK
ncbi:MAG TPA: DUF6508 domain-containing protein [Chitinophagales bacterium]|nr:DUF6508 domain-containing protein [Chitinophagales bacterium]